MSITKVPSIPSVDSASVTDILQSVRLLLEVREGNSGNPLDANVTYRDLVSLNLAVDPSGEVTYAVGSATATNTPVAPTNTDPDGYNPTTDLTPPPQPTTVVAAGSIGLVYITWDVPSYRNHSYSEVWRSDTDDIAAATKVGTSSSQSFVDTPPNNSTKYYWVRFTSKANVTGVYSDSVSAKAALDPALVVAAMQQSVSEDLLTTELASKINRLDANSDIVGSIQNALAIEKKVRETNDGNLYAQYTVKIDQNGYVTGYGLASQTVSGVPTSSFQIRADRFSIVNPATNRVTVSSITRTTTVATLNTATAHGLVAGDEFTLIGVVNDKNWNGTYTVATRPTTTQITFTVPSTLTTPAVVDANTKVGKAVIPFIVDNGEVYLDTVTIKSASISSAMISSLVANKITAGYINAAVGINGASVFGAELYAGGTTTVATDANGNVTGFTANNPTVKIAGGNAEFVATSFKVKSSATGTPTTTVPFEVVNGTVYLKSAVIQDASITLAQIDTATVTTLSAITADMGTITAGKMQSTDGKFVIDLTNKTISIEV